MKKLLELYKKNEEIINYLIVGGATTVLCWVVKLILKYNVFDVDISWQNAVVNIIAWVVGVIFAYFTNRIFVFKSKAKNMFKEFISFSAGRVATLILDIIVMELCYNIIGTSYLAALLISAVLVTIGNYLLSKLFVFKKA